MFTELETKSYTKKKKKRETFFLLTQFIIYFAHDCCCHPLPDQLYFLLNFIFDYFSCLESDIYVIEAYKIIKKK